MNAPVDRYARHRAIAGFSQEALQASRYAVIGAGAIGNEVIKNLCLLGVGAVDVYDFDTVERHNLTRSVLLREADVGAPKAEAVALHARALDPAVTVTAIPGDIRDTLGVAAIGRYAAVIGALDNFEARLRLNQLCWLGGVDWVNAAIDSRAVSVESFPFATEPGAESPACYECGLPASVYGRIAERYSCGGLLRAALRERVMPTTAITASIAGAQAVQAALAPRTDARTARRWWFDTASGLASVARIPRNPACPACGDLPHRPSLTTAPDGRCATIAGIAAAAGEMAVRLSDPVIWRCACVRCGPSSATEAVLRRPARAVTDRITHCPRCNDTSIQVEIRDLLDVDELRAPPGAHGGDVRLPVRFALAGDLCIDLPMVAPSTDGAHRRPPEGN